MDAYVSPILTQYIQSFESKFVGGLAGDRCDFMKSDGGLVASSKFTGVRALLSGPAGGVVGCAITAYSSSRRRPVVAFDMGGTSTDGERVRVLQADPQCRGTMGCTRPSTSPLPPARGSPCPSSVLRRSQRELEVMSFLISAEEAVRGSSTRTTCSLLGPKAWARIQARRVTEREER